ncbi:MAG: YcxB family protein [Lachnospiraceae bacterium]|nr:YcxB family protein [Lachnospiraceae bacterium]
MGTVHLECDVGVQEYRQASYYALFSRKKPGFLLCAVILALTVLYGLLIILGLLPFKAVAFFIAGAELLWLLLQFASAERRIFQYIKSEESMIGVPFRADLDAQTFHIEIPAKDLKGEVAYKDLYLATELSSLFMISVNESEMFILPTRCFTDEQRTWFRHTLARQMQDGFISRYDYFRKG